MNTLVIWDEFTFNCSAFLLVFLLFVINRGLVGMKTKFNPRMFKS